jgi:TolB-like protein/transposase
MTDIKYVAFDLHQATISAAVLDLSGKLITQAVFQTDASAIRDFLRGLSGTLHLTFEEGTQAQWLFDLTRPLLSELTVCNPRENHSMKRGNKSDQKDAQKLATLLRAGMLKSVYHGCQQTKTLKHLAHNYDSLTQDTTRTINRLKAVYRSQAIKCAGRDVYYPRNRQGWLAKIGAEGLQKRAEFLYRQLDHLRELRREAKKALLKEARQHSAYKRLCGVPGLGPTRVAQIIAAIGSPHRFRTKRQLWGYCGFGLITRSSADYQVTGDKLERRHQQTQTRGLNQNFSRRLKEAFKGAALEALKTEAFKKIYEQPFVGETTSDVLAAILKSEPAPLSQYVSGISPESEQIVGRTLRKNAGERYQTVKDLLIDLRDFKQDLEFGARLERAAALPKATLNKTAATKFQTARATSRIGYLAGEIKNNRIAALATLMGLMAGITALYYFTRGGVSNHQTSSTQQTSAATIDSIAVLPFANAAQDPNAEYLSDGITESLINRLSQLSGLKVMSSGSVFRYKGKEQDIQKVGKDLNVRAVLIGSVKQIGDQLVINVSLDDAQDNHRIWGEHYVRKFADVLAVQNEIAQAVSTSLRVKLTGAEQQQLAKRYTESVEAYELYLKGNYEWNKHTQEDLQKSIEYYNQALEKDPNYALAYTGLAESYGVLGNNYLPPSEAFPKAKAYATKALQIDETLGEAHAVMAATRLFYDWNWAESEREVKRALVLNPSFEGAHDMHSVYLEVMGRLDEAKAESKRARELNTFAWLDKAYQDRTYLLIWLKVEPRFDSLHGDPRFQDLLRRIGLQP